MRRLIGNGAHFLQSENGWGSRSTAHDFLDDTERGKQITKLQKAGFANVYALDVEDEIADAAKALVEILGQPEMRCPDCGKMMNNLVVYFRHAGGKCDECFISSPIDEAYRKLREALAAM